MVCGKPLKGSGWSGSDDSRTYSFDKPAGAAVTVTISYWEDSAERTVAFTQDPAPAKR